jgi:hypothetical protein
MRCTRWISCLAMVGTLVAFVAVPAGAVDPTISATPHRKLADGQTINVSASGFPANIPMVVVECPTTTVTPDTCDLNTVQVAFTDATGAYADFPFPVARILSDGTDCALNGGCYVGTQSLDATGPTAATLLRFDPNIPPLPPLEVAVRVDKTPKVNDKGVVEMRGTVECRNRGAQVEVDLDLTQVYNRSIFESFGFTEVLCTADTTTPFRMTIRPFNGLFGPGPAVAHLQAFAGNLFIFRRVALDLQARGTTAAARTTPKPRLTWQ